MPPKQQRNAGTAAAVATPGASGLPRPSLLTESDESLEPVLLLPTDGGYAWVVAIACFFMNLIADGCIYSFGFYQESIQHEFKKGAAEVALLPSICSGFYYLAVAMTVFQIAVYELGEKHGSFQSSPLYMLNSLFLKGPIWCAIGNRWGFRLVSVAGALSSAGALIACAFIEHFSLFILTYGLLLGISSGAVYISTTIVVGFYFERWRGVATCLTSCGSGIGVMMMPLCYRALQTVEGYTWRWVFMLNSSLLATAGILGLLLRPLRPVAMTRGERTVRFQDDNAAVKGKKGLRLLRQRGNQGRQ